MKGGCNIGGEKLWQDEGVLCGHILDHRDGLKKCIVTQICLCCGKITSFIYFIIYFIILPHTMNYKQNKNDNK